MEKDVIISIKGTQKYEHNAPDVIELVTQGRLKEREGGVNSQMVFQEGRRHMSMYNTPYGAIEIGISTRHLMADLHAQGGNIEIDYAIEVDHALAGRNIFQINVKEAQGTGLKQ